MYPGNRPRKNFSNVLPQSRLTIAVCTDEITFCIFVNCTVTSQLLKTPQLENQLSVPWYYQ